MCLGGGGGGGGIIRQSDDGADATPRGSGSVPCASGTCVRARRCSSPSSSPRTCRPVSQGSYTSGVVAQSHRATNTDAATPVPASTVMIGTPRRTPPSPCPVCVLALPPPCAARSPSSDDEGDIVGGCVSTRDGRATSRNQGGWRRPSRPEAWPLRRQPACSVATSALRLAASSACLSFGMPIVLLFVFGHVFQ